MGLAPACTKAGGKECRNQTALRMAMGRVLKGRPKRTRTH